MEKPRVRPLWLLLFLLIPLLIFVPLVLRNNVSTASAIFDIKQETILQWLLFGGLAGVRLGFIGFVIAFFAWVRRRVEMPSFPWLIVYFITSWIFTSLGALAFQAIIALKAGPTSGGSLTTLFQYWNIGQTLTSTIAVSILGVLLASDFLFLLRRLGVEADNGAVRVLARAREYVAPLGIAMVAFQLAPLFFWLYFYFS